MSEILFKYQPVDPVTWAYLSSLLSIALYFKFSRVWSVRNLDLLGLILLAPALLLVNYGVNHGAVDPQAKLIEHVGHIWLLAASGLFLLRSLLDAVMVRRPLLEPNLTVGGLVFLGLSLLVFLAANSTVAQPQETDLVGSRRAAHLRDRVAATRDIEALATHGPGVPLLYFVPHVTTDWLLENLARLESLGQENGNSPADDDPLAENLRPTAVGQPALAANGGGAAAAGDEAANAGADATLADRDPSAGPEEPADDEAPAAPAAAPGAVDVVTTRTMAILSQVAIVVGIVLVGLRHFDNIKTGVAAATLYLLLPYTSIWMGNVTHALPGALVVWAIVFYRRPLVAGLLIGLATGTIYYAAFLLPLWISFYWQRGLIRFLGGVAVMAAVIASGLALTSIDGAMFLDGLRQMFSLRFPAGDNLSGVWQFWNPVYRWPILAAFAGLSLSFALWPAQKNLGTLIGCSAAILLGTQFWHAHSGGLALAWYLPLLLLTMFRPNLEDRIALAVIR